MAFCTSCGATVQGAFCPQCGTPVSAAAQAAAPPPGQMSPVPPQAQMAPPPLAAPPAKGKISPLVWVLLVIVGIVVLGIVGLIGTGMYIARNPGMVLAKLITASNPNAEVVGTDLGSQTMRIRDRKTGEEVTVSFDDIKKGRIQFSARGLNGEVANLEMGGGVGKLPAWVPVYPGAKAEGNMTAKGDDGNGIGEGGVVTFTTPDSGAQVRAYYETKCKEMGMTVNLAVVNDAGGMVAGEDAVGKRTLHVIVGSGGGKTTFTVTYGRKR